MTEPLRSGRFIRGEAAFDRALANAARSVVVEPLPAGVLHVPRPVAPGSWLRFQAPLGAAVVFAILAMGIAIGAPSLPGASAQPVFRTGNEIVLDLRRSGYSCRTGDPASPGQPRMEAIVCMAPPRDLEASVILSEDPTGRLAEFHASSNMSGPASSTVLGAPVTTADAKQLDLLEQLIGLPFADPASSAAAQAWLHGRLPLEAGRRIATTIHGVPVVLERAVRGGYRIVVGDLGVGGTALPSR